MENLNNNNQPTAPISGRELQKHALKSPPKMFKFIPPSQYFPRVTREGSVEWHDMLLNIPIDENIEQDFLALIDVHQDNK